MRTTERRIAELEARTTTTDNPLLAQPERYTLGYHLMFTRDATRPPHYIIDHATGRTFDAVGDWATWAVDVATTHKRTGADLRLTFGVATKGGDHGKP
jgi:hypothetical protein